MPERAVDAGRVHSSYYSSSKKKKGQRRFGRRDSYFPLSLYFRKGEGGRGEREEGRLVRLLLILSFSYLEEGGGEIKKKKE